MVSTDTTTYTARIFSAFADETRLQILKLLMQDTDICVSSMADKLDISISAVSQQCKLLELSGVIVRNRRGQKICYQLNNSDSTVTKLLTLIRKEVK